MVRRHMVGNQPQERYLFLSAGEGSGRDPENGLVHASTDQELLRHGERGGVEREVEVDETYVGGKNKNRHASKKVRNSQGVALKIKHPCWGWSRETASWSRKTVQDTSARVITPEIVKRVKDAILYTDEWLGYNTVDKMYEHFIVKHKNGEYVNGKAYTNTIEGFWSLLKRGIFGIYHFTSKKHLQRYVDEPVFRYNLREMSDGNRFNLFLCKSEYRITYKELVYGQAA
ncbi:MAG: IS1595 family transposase [Butyricimonas virosa]